jgi:hypothetical protein
MKAMAIALITVGLAALPAPAAFAAAPANDDFAAAKDLGAGSLPIAVTGTNVEATKEAEEPAAGSLGFAATGHTVWFEWEATGTEFVTVGTCGSQIRPTLGVYKGTAVNALTEVAGSFASEGPDCPGSNGVAVTFKAVTGVSYEIVVDGLIKFPGESAAEAGQGSIALELASTPKAANDNFAAATVLNGEILWNGVYAAAGSGFTWNATKEAGEPAHAGNQGGASVWYAWTAPAAGSYGVTACGRFGKPLLAVYTGSAVGALTPVAADDHSCAVLRFDASQGTTYHLAIDGKFEAGSALVGSVSINVVREPPTPPREEAPPPPLPPFALSRPDTFLEKRVLKAARRRVTFLFAASDAGARFRCKLDERPFSSCQSPKTYAGLAPGNHVFKVMAIGHDGHTDLTPARSRFRVPRRQHRAH